MNIASNVTKWLLIMAFFILLAACSAPPATTPNPPGLPSPTINPEPSCTLVPQITGEKVIPLTLGTPPSPGAQPGQKISLNFSGGYIILNHAEVCGDNEIVGYIFADELPEFSYQRQVDIMIDEAVLSELDCEYDCFIEVTIPKTTSSGSHRLHLRVPQLYGYRELDFDLEITPQP